MLRVRPACVLPSNEAIEKGHCVVAGPAYAVLGAHREPLGMELLVEGQMVVGQSS